MPARFHAGEAILTDPPLAPRRVPQIRPRDLQYVLDPRTRPRMPSTDRPAGVEPGMSDVPTALADLVLPDATGRSHRLGDLWTDRTVVLAFLRHYG